MKILRSLENLKSQLKTSTVVTLGNFDGIHLGHQALLERTKEISLEKGLPSCVVTYYPNPALVLGKDKDLGGITTQADKENLIESYGIDWLIVVPFTLEFAQMEAEDFLKNILIQELGAKSILIGFNHCFGKGRRGDFELLQKYSSEFGYDLEKLDPVFLGGTKLSSSYIRSLLREGKVAEAEECLGREFSVSGTVVEGHKRGRAIGFPTANVKPFPELILPGVGVYAGHTEVEGKAYPSMINIGNNPTFGDNAIALESHIFDFSGDIYGKTVRVSFSERIRAEVKFSGVDALVEQLKKDETVSRKILTER
ncbi:bifunctional riboflavin kinase/FAD synthetase [Leptospira langatensis]|uniref:Riboflavin biosynthesis protein n=1 Tax=Leptospira langatensis TaxID=2484983 RepID=A0A5F1ZXM5_9LEPT|nr:bifunctional riboflavin kinase/FAD synthetase [Leptospira langatensis]TGK01157.1 bifunctional riboflavin kinase/FAD synthetase [Leptospira langatensis]TGL42391.1 bifunctional riboflavin kinase/FAD synthetase [Leptospira langatensis]